MFKKHGLLDISRTGSCMDPWITWAEQEVKWSSMFLVWPSQVKCCQGPLRRQIQPWCIGTVFLCISVHPLQFDWESYKKQISYSQHMRLHIPSGCPALISRFTEWAKRASHNPYAASTCRTDLVRSLGSVCLWLWTTGPERETAGLAVETQCRITPVLSGRQPFR